LHIGINVSLETGNISLPARMCNGPVGVHKIEPFEVIFGWELANEHLGWYQKPHNLCKIHLLNNLGALTQCLVRHSQVGTSLFILLIIEIVPALEIGVLDLQGERQGLESEGREVCLIRVDLAHPLERLLECVKVIAALFVVVQFEPQPNPPDLDEQVAVLTVVIS
jgi:hypothetical protein